MSETLKAVTLAGTPSDSYERAIRTATRDEATSACKLSWLELKELRGPITNGAVAEFRVKLQAGCKVET